MFTLCKPLTKLAVVSALSTLSTLSLGTNYVKKSAHCDVSYGETIYYPDPEHQKKFIIIKGTKHNKISYAKYVEYQQKVTMLTNISRECIMEISDGRDIFGFDKTGAVEWTLTRSDCNKYKIVRNYLKSLIKSNNEETNDFVTHMLEYIENPVDKSAIPKSLTLANIPNLKLFSSLKYSNDELIDLMISNEQICAVVEQVYLLLINNSTPVQNFLLKNNVTHAFAF